MEKEMKISDKLVKIDNSYTVNQYDNGFMVEVSGQDSEDDWTNVKIVCNSIDDVLAVVTEASKMKRT
jgi:hypothetical protein